MSMIMGCDTYWTLMHNPCFCEAELFSYLIAHSKLALITEKVTKNIKSNKTSNTRQAVICKSTFIICQQYNLPFVKVLFSDLFFLV